MRSHSRGMTNGTPSLQGLQLPLGYQSKDVMSTACHCSSIKTFSLTLKGRALVAFSGPCYISSRLQGMIQHYKKAISPSDTHFCPNVDAWGWMRSWQPYELQFEMNTRLQMHFNRCHEGYSCMIAHVKWYSIVKKKASMTFLAFLPDLKCPY